MSNEKSTAEVNRESTALARIKLDPQALIEKAVETGAGIETLERLVALAKDVRAMQAREAWLAAMAKFQEECPSILKTKTAQIATRGGSRFGYSYAPLDEILNKVQPVMGPLGLSISFRVRYEKGQVGAVGIVSHEMGHAGESGEVVMPIEMTAEGGTGANPAQRVTIATTYAKRQAVLAILGIAPEDDPDAKAENAIPATAAQSESRSPRSSGERNVWVGKILNVKSKSGKSTKTGKDWTKYTLQTSDAQEFETFSESHAKFAREAGSSPVQIEWEPGQYGKTILSIGPVEVEADGPEA